MKKPPRAIFDGASYDLHDGESVLDGLIRGGADINFSCRKGTCHACMLKAVRGTPGAESQRGVRPQLKAQGYFLPCQSHPEGKIWLERPNPADTTINIFLAEREVLSPHVVRLRFEAETQFQWRAGQFASLQRDGVVRSYSLASIPEVDYFIEFHIKREPGGALSPWLCDELNLGDTLELQGPFGRCYYDAEDANVPILAIGTSTGLAPLLGLARDALHQEHRGPIHLYAGARDSDNLYLVEQLTTLAQEHANLHYWPSVSRGEPPTSNVAQGRAVDLAFDAHPDIEGWRVYLAGNPEMVFEGRYRAVLAGVARAAIHADPFESSAPFTPNDTEKMKALPAEPELWEALGHGEGLRPILHDFYNRAFEDVRLAPFFHNVTKKRAIGKQYEFLSTAFSGEGTFFGLRPFNAHHWMIISDELFDYREELFDECVRRSGLSEHLHRRWRAFHEAFRREIVKSTARGLILDGVEHHFEGYSEETLDIGVLCDGCQAEMAAGTTGRMHRRTGQLFCDGCAKGALRASDFPTRRPTTIPPP